MDYITKLWYHIDIKMCSFLFNNVKNFISVVQIKTIDIHFKANMAIYYVCLFEVSMLILETLTELEKCNH